MKTGPGEWEAQIDAESARWWELELLEDGRRVRLFASHVDVQQEAYVFTLLMTGTPAWFMPVAVIPRTAVKGGWYDQLDDADMYDY